MHRFKEQVVLFHLGSYGVEMHLHNRNLNVSNRDQLLITVISLQMWTTQLLYIIIRKTDMTHSKLTLRR